MTAFINVDGDTVLSASLHVPNIGPWWADVLFETAPEISGLVTLVIGSLSLTGTIVERESSSFAGQRYARIVAGAAGWGSLVEAQHYHSDSSIRAQSIAEDAARLIGETIGSFVVPNAFVGIDYSRQAGLASRVIEDVIQGAPWHVDYSGNTNIGERSTSQARPSDYQVLDFDLDNRLVTLAVDDLTTIGVGSIISEGLNAAETVYELQVKATADSVRVKAWVGGTLTDRGRLAQLFRNITKRSTDNRLFGKYRFRVTAMSGDRTELQAVVQQAGLPDALPISMAPGVAGAHAKLTPGTIVLVEFVEGDRTLPIVTAFAGKDGTGHTADELDLSVTTKIRLGSDAAIDAVALAPSIDSQLDAINSALDAFAAAVAVPNDGGAAIQLVFSGIWGAVKPPSNVGATKVDAE